MKRFSRLLGVALVVGGWLFPIFPLFADSFSEDIVQKAVGFVRQEKQKMAQAQAERNKNEQTRLRTLFARVPLAPVSKLITVGNPWTSQNRQKQYSWSKPNGVSKTADTVLYDSPWPVGPILEHLFESFPKEAVEKIASDCSVKYSQAWDRIGCLSFEINHYLENYDFSGNQSFCKAHAEAFDKIFAKLNLPNTFSQHIGASGGQLSTEAHVNNVILITNETGLVFSYVIDNGNFPGIVFPLNENAIRFHDRSGNGKTTYFRLPDIPQSQVPVRYQATP